MSSGLKKTEVSNPLATVPVVQPLASMIDPEDRDYLPTFKLPFGIENIQIPVLDDKGNALMAKGVPVMQSATGRMIISSGKGKLVPIPVPYIITAYTIRGATKRVIDKDGKKVYERTFASMDPAQPNSDKHKAAEAAGKTGGIDVGNVVLGVVLWGEGDKAMAVVGLMDCFKTLTKYWVEPLKTGGMLQQKQGVRVNIEDHNANMTTSGNGYNYYDSRKFTQWQSVSLTPEQLSLACAALANKKATIEGWLKKEE